MKISVIVPVYNAEKYIDRCIKSIIGQTYTEWELFLINDGSSDNSLSIILKYAKKDKRITVISQNNQGAGAARNKGLDYVSGDYIVFVDSDDYIEPQYFELLSIHLEDIVFIDVNRRDSKGNITKKEKFSKLKDKKKDDILRDQMTGKALWGGVRKAVKSSLINQYGIRFSQHTVGEEAIYSFLLLFYAKTFSFIDRPVYNYEVHCDSLSQTIQEDPWGPVSLALVDKIKELGYYEKYANTLNSFILTAGMISLIRLAKLCRYKEFKKKAKEKIREINQQMDSDFYIDTKHIINIVMVLRILIYLHLYRIIYFAANLK